MKKLAIVLLVALSSTFVNAQENKPAAKAESKKECKKECKKGSSCCKKMEKAATKKS